MYRKALTMNWPRLSRVKDLNGRTCWNNQNGHMQNYGSKLPRIASLASMQTPLFGVLLSFRQSLSCRFADSDRWEVNTSSAAVFLLYALKMCVLARAVSHLMRHIWSNVGGVLLNLEAEATARKISPLLLRHTSFRQFYLRGGGWRAYLQVSSRNQARKKNLKKDRKLLCSLVIISFLPLVWKRQKRKSSRPIALNRHLKRRLSAETPISLVGANALKQLLLFKSFFFFKVFSFSRCAPMTGLRLSSD